MKNSSHLDETYRSSTQLQYCTQHNERCQLLSSEDIDSYDQGCQRLSSVEASHAFSNQYLRVTSLQEGWSNAEQIESSVPRELLVVH